MSNDQIVYCVIGFILTAVSFYFIGMQHGANVMKKAIYDAWKKETSEGKCLN